MSGINKSAEDGGAFSSKVINIVFITLLLDLLGFTLILPLLPSILDHYAQTGVSFACFISIYNPYKVLLQQSADSKCAFEMCWLINIRDNIRIRINGELFYIVSIWIFE